MDGTDDTESAGTLAARGDGRRGRRARPSRGKWTADTEAAFLLALRLCGQPTKAAAEIGRSHAAAYGYRQRNPDFARRWDEAIAEQQREWIAAHQGRLAVARGALEDEGAGGGRLMPWRERSDGWTQRKRTAFLKALRRTKCVKQACEAAGVSDTSAYYLKSREPRFAAAWEKALAGAAPPSVLDAALARAVEGWDEPIVHGGEIVGYTKVYSEGLLRDLLKDEQARKAEAAAADRAKAAEAEQPIVSQPSRATEAELADAILRGLTLRAAQKREKAERMWERWRLGWVDPALAARSAEELAEEAKELAELEEADWGED